MSELQIGLLAAGVLVVAGIIAYNAIQERRARHSAERAFRSGHADALMEDGAQQRREPSFEGAPRRDATLETAALPDTRLDYVIELGLRQLVSAAAVAEHWAPFEHRFAGRALLAASPDRSAWRPLSRAGSCAAVRAALQLASRAGPVGEAELIEFRAAADALAASIGATVQAPEVKHAVEAARELDQLCADADIQVVLHVVPNRVARLMLERPCRRRGSMQRSPSAAARTAPSACRWTSRAPRKCAAAMTRWWFARGICACRWAG